MSTSAAASAVEPNRPSSVAALVRSEGGIVTAALAVVGVPVVADNYVLPQPGTSPRDHLTSGLVPLAILLGAAVLYPRLRAGARAAVAMTFGGLAFAAGFPGAYYLLHGEASGAHYAGLLAIAAGGLLIVSGAVTLWKSRRPDGSRRRRYLRRAARAVFGALAALAVSLYVVVPIGFAYGYTHLGRIGPPPDVGVPSETITVTTTDSLELFATYVPSKNRAAVVVFPGSSAVKEARMLARHGYGVLLLDPRGQGRSEGDLVRWAGDRDLIAAAKYLQGRSDVDPARIGGFGSSVGGEILLVAAGQSTAFKAVVSEGAGFPVGDAEFPGVRGAVLAPFMLMVGAATTVFSNHQPPAPIVDRIARIAPRPVFLIYADPGMGGEKVRQPKYYAAAGEPKQIWKVPGAEHTGGIDVRPAEYERRVIAFFDAALRP